ncbi:hypothetical protein [Caballeronia cordobensis]|uniref:hypothetical protein n=1 Tax=Caballeronia cordobensis TaxID=1353886 RepID=UPI00045F03E5|nr:putative membrane protein [Burkholderia sp. RPE67]
MGLLGENEASDGGTVPDAAAIQAAIDLAEAVARQAQEEANAAKTAADAAVTADPSGEPELRKTADAKAMDAATKQTTVLLLKRQQQGLNIDTFTKGTQKLLSAIGALPRSTALGQDALYTLAALVIINETDAARRKASLDMLRKLGGDRWTFRSAIWGLVALALLSVIFMFVLGLTNNANQYTTGILAIATACVAGLAGLLTPRGAM